MSVSGLQHIKQLTSLIQLHDNRDNTRTQTELALSWSWSCYLVIEQRLRLQWKCTRVYKSQRHSVTGTRHLQAPAEDTSFRCFPFCAAPVFFCNVDWCTVFLKFFYLTTPIIHV